MKEKIKEEKNRLNLERQEMRKKVEELNQQKELVVQQLQQAVEIHNKIVAQIEILDRLLENVPEEE